MPNDRWKPIILQAFDNKCLICGYKTEIVHEFVPGHGDFAMLPENRAPLCDRCHNWAHRVGTKVSRQRLVELNEIYFRNKYGMTPEEYYGNYAETEARIPQTL